MWFGRNKLIKIALEHHNIPDDFLKLLKGTVGIITTDLDKSEVQDILQQHEQVTQLKSGQRTPKTIKLHQGALFRGGQHSIDLGIPSNLAGEEEAMPPSLELQLRKLGVPTKLNKGVVELFKDFVVCEEGKLCSPEQAQILVRLTTRLFIWLTVTETLELEHFNIQGDNTRRIPRRKSHTLRKSKGNC